MTRLLDATTNSRLPAAIRVGVGAIAFLRGIRLAIEASDQTLTHLALIGLWLVLAVLVTSGRHARVAAGGMVVLWALMLRVDSGFFYWNFIYLIVLALLLVAVSDCERHFVAGRPATPSVLVPAWPLTLMAVQVSLVYGFTALAKMNGRFLAGDVLGHYFEQAVLPTPAPEALFGALAIATVVAELFIAVALWSRRLRPVAFAVAGPLHLGMLFATTTVLQLYAVALFAALMYVLFAAFLDVPAKGHLVVWDDSCSFCRRWVAGFRRLDAFGTLDIVGASSPEAYEHTGVTPLAAASAMQLVEPDGTVRSGYDAVWGIIAVLPGGYLLAPWLRLPGIRTIGRASYTRVAARRTCAYHPTAV